MSGLLSIVREFLLFTAPTKFQEAHLFWASARIAFVLASVTYCVIVTKEKSEAEGAKAALETKYFGERPRLSMDILSTEGMTAWRQTNQPAQFLIHYLSGRIPTDVRFDPIASKLGSYSLQFDSLPHIDTRVRNLLAYDVLSVGHASLGHKDRSQIGQVDGEMLRLFILDSPKEPNEVVFALTSRYRDNEEERTQTFYLRFDQHRFRFLRNTA